MASKAQIRDYRPKLTVQARDTLIEMARALGYIVTQPGRYFGEPTPPEMLDALAAAYRRDSGSVIDAMRDIGVDAGSPTADFFND